MVKGIYLNGEQDLTQVFSIRRQVFVEEQKIAEDIVFDGMDAYAMHALVFAGDKPVASGRIIFDGDTYKLGRIAVLKEERGKQYGDFIVRMLLDKVFLHGAEEVAVSSQLSAIGFYEKIGFERNGEEYIEADIPHVPMRLKHENLCHKCQGH